MTTSPLPMPSSQNALATLFERSEMSMKAKRARSPRQSHHTKGVSARRAPTVDHGV